MPPSRASAPAASGQPPAGCTSRTTRSGCGSTPRPTPVRSEPRRPPPTWPSGRCPASVTSDVAFTATLTPAQRSVEPGGAVSFALDLPEAARVELGGPVAEWAVVTGRRVVVHVPRSARVSPGARALLVRAVAPDGEGAR